MTGNGTHGINVDGEICLITITQYSPRQPPSLPGRAAASSHGRRPYFPIASLSSSIQNIILRLRPEQFPVQVIPFHQVLVAVKGDDLRVLQQQDLVAEGGAGHAVGDEDGGSQRDLLRHKNIIKIVF